MPLIEPDPLADPRRVDPRTYRLDDAGPVEMRDHPVPDHRAPLPGTAFHVQRVDARRVHPHEHLAVTRGRRVLLAELKYVLRRAEFGIPSCTHLISPSGLVRTI